MTVFDVCGNIKKVHPVIHSITNYVTVNPCANIVLAAGGSPIMADSPEEMKEIVAISNAVSINIGTLSPRTVEAMLAAAKQAKIMSRPVVLDPVGAGASAFRMKICAELLATGAFGVIRGNLSEFKALAGIQGVSRGVDASSSDLISEDNLEHAVAFAKRFASDSKCVAAVSGAIDIVAAPDGRVGLVRNGDPIMSKITGCGCMLTCLTAVCCASSEHDLFTGALAATCMMGVAGDIAKAGLMPSEGNATCCGRIIDAIYNMTPAILKEKVKYEISV